MAAPRYFEEFQAGEVIESRSRMIEAGDMKIFSGCTSLLNRVFTDPVYCKQVGNFDRPPIASSLLLNILDSFFAMDVSPDKVPILHYGYDKVRFIKPVYAGDTVHAKYKLVDTRIKNDEFGVLTWEVRAYNQNDELVSFHEDKLYVGRYPK